MFASIPTVKYESPHAPSYGNRTIQLKNSTVKIVPFVEQLDSISVLENGLRALAEESPEKAYLLAIAIDKVASAAKKENAEAFKKFFDAQ